MKRQSTRTENTPMNADAYAGFLKLWLTPTSTMPPITGDVEAYLRHCNAREPLPAAVDSCLEKPSKQAA